MIDFAEGHTFLIDKPFGWSSFQLVKKVRYLTKVKKVGHAGTLDPLATGLMIICTGKNTKKIQQYQDQNKTYTGIIRLGSTTPSYDLETEINKTFPTAHINAKKISDAVGKLTGKILQNPPAFSAIKITGKRAYLSARKGNIEPLPAREVFIENFDVEDALFPDIQFTIRCSKGTYIRSIADTLGKLLDSGAHLAKLCRTHIGMYDLKDAESIRNFENRIKTNKSTTPQKEK